MVDCQLSSKALLSSWRCPQDPDLAPFGENRSCIGLWKAICPLGESYIPDNAYTLS